MQKFWALPDVCWYLRGPALKMNHSKKENFKWITFQIGSLDRSCINLLLADYDGNILGHRPEQLETHPAQTKFLGKKQPGWWFQPPVFGGGSSYSSAHLKPSAILWHLSTPLQPSHFHLSSAHSCDFIFKVLNITIFRAQNAGDQLSIGVNTTAAGSNFALAIWRFRHRSILRKAWSKLKKTKHVNI